MKAMVLAAGQGTRLRPLTEHIPKVMVPLADTPLIKLTLLWLKSHGIREVAINLHHLGQQIIDYLQDGSGLGMRVLYSEEESLLGTAGGVKKVETFFGDTFVVVYGDVLTNLNLTAMARRHLRMHAAATVALVPTPRPSEVGIVEMDREGRILSFVEKPAPGTEPSNLSNAGVYVLQKSVLKLIPGNCYYDFGFHVFPDMLRAGEAIYGYVLQPGEYLIDIGSPERYEQAKRSLESGVGSRES